MKIHLKFGTPAALCGNKTFSGLTTFFAVAPENRCTACIRALTARGESAEALELRLRRETEKYRNASRGN
jgi:hypothetical protein